METTYTKLGNLVNDTFTVVEAGGYKWKMWNNETKKMEMSDDYQKGFQKKYTVKTDKGILDLGSGQLASLLEAVYYQGEADIRNKTFAVKSNGKTGMDIRYFFNPVRASQQSHSDNEPDMDKPFSLDSIKTSDDSIDLSSIPF